MATKFYTWSAESSYSLGLHFSLPSAGGAYDVLQGGSYGAGSCGTPTMDCGGAFSVGDPIATDSGGRAVLATTGDLVLGHALEASSGPGDTAVIGIHLSCYKL